MRYGGYDLQKASKATTTAPPHQAGTFHLKKVQNTACQIMEKFNTKLHHSLRKLYSVKAFHEASGRNSPISYRGSLFDTESSSEHARRREDSPSVRYTESDFRPHFDLSERKDQHNYIFGTNIYNLSARNMLNGKSTIKILNTFKEIEESNSMESFKSAKNSLQRLKEERKTIFKELLELSSCDESLEFRLVKDYLECNSYSEIENDTEFKEYLQRKNYSDILSYLDDCHEPKSLMSISSSVARAQSAMAKGSLNSLKLLSTPKSLKGPKRTPQIESRVCSTCRSSMAASYSSCSSFENTLKAPKLREPLEKSKSNNFFSTSYREILKFCQEFFEESFSHNDFEMPKFTFNKFKEQKYEQILKEFVLNQGYGEVQDYVEAKFGQFIEQELTKYCSDLQSSGKPYKSSTACSCEDNCSECVNDKCFSKYLYIHTCCHGRL